MAPRGALARALVCGVVLFGGAGSARAQDSAAVEIGTVRFYRGGQTLVDAFCRIPLGWLARLPGDAAGRGGYRIAVAVRDSSGLELVKQTWSQRVPTELLQVAGALTTEHFAFAAPAGAYTVEVTVTDSASARVGRRRATVRTFAGRPAASDLLLANAMRQAVGPGDTVPRGGEIRKGSLFIQTSGVPMLTPRESRLDYYEELYPARAESATVKVRVMAAAGTQVVAALPQRIALDAAGGVTEGTLDLGGLPPGAYTLEVAVALADSEVTRSAAFGMTGFETVAKIAELAPPAAAAAADPFAGLDERQLDSLYQPLVYLMKPEEAGVYSGLTVDGKRAYLRRFWASRNATPGATRNETMERFYAYVRDADDRFREQGASQMAGWRTDRGRIFIKNGPPDEVLSRPQSGSTKPYEVWKYTRGRPRKYIFMDLTQFGNYALIWTDDRREPTLPNWNVLLGQEATIDAFRF